MVILNLTVHTQIKITEELEKDTQKQALRTAALLEKVKPSTHGREIIFAVFSVCFTALGLNSLFMYFSNSK